SARRSGAGTLDGMARKGGRVKLHSAPLVLAGLLAWSCQTGDSAHMGLSPADMEAIGALRAALVEAIETGDAAKYASLCTDDVQLLHPNVPLITGRAELQAHNAAIFAIVRVVSLKLSPRAVYGTADVAYEVGTQQLAIEPALPGFRSHRQYVHVFRRDSTGAWKFAVLASNDSE
ncbi:MAG TPA: nuclear transport factor 2 family protein, partial [Gemmatimonadales bacterium]|nr:nuclear transport factor 2 family protein [Gemmatimonadales bacterium]